MQRKDAVAIKPTFKEFGRFWTVARSVTGAARPVAENANRAAFLASANFSQSFTFWKITNNFAVKGSIGLTHSITYKIHFAKDYAIFQQSRKLESLC